MSESESRLSTVKRFLLLSILFQVVVRLVIFGYMLYGGSLNLGELSSFWLGAVPISLCTSYLGLSMARLIQRTGAPLVLFISLSCGLGLGVGWYVAVSKFFGAWGMAFSVPTWVSLSVASGITFMLAGYKRTERAHPYVIGSMLAVIVPCGIHEYFIERYLGDCVEIQFLRCWTGDVPPRVLIQRSVLLSDEQMLRDAGVSGKLGVVGWSKHTRGWKGEPKLRIVVVMSEMPSEPIEFRIPDSGTIACLQDRLGYRVHPIASNGGRSLRLEANARRYTLDFSGGVVGGQAYTW